MTLDELKPGQECRVITVDIDGATGQRLLDMGSSPELRCISFGMHPWWIPSSLWYGAAMSAYATLRPGG